MVTPEPLALLDLKEKLAHLATLFHPKCPDLPAQLEPLAKMVPLAKMALLDLLDLLDLKDLPDPLAKMVPPAILAVKDPKEKLELMDIPEPQAKMAKMVHPALFPAPLVPLDLLAHLATMALLVRTVNPAQLALQAKTERTALPATQVRLEL